jgi:hypothetical protein
MIEEHTITERTGKLGKKGETVGAENWEWEFT